MGSQERRQLRARARQAGIDEARNLVVDLHRDGPFGAAHRDQVVESQVRNRAPHGMQLSDALGDGQKGLDGVGGGEEVAGADQVAPRFGIEPLADPIPVTLGRTAEVDVPDEPPGRQVAQRLQLKPQTRRGFRRDPRFRLEHADEYRFGVALAVSPVTDRAVPFMHERIDPVLIDGGAAAIHPRATNRADR